MTTPYLILHKVRGEAAFDIGEEIAPEVWIIPTSGHRAYPWRKWRLDELQDGSDIMRCDRSVDYGFGFHNYPANATDTVPADWPDHYAVNDRKHKIERAILDVATEMADLGLEAEDLNAALATVLEKRK